MTDAITLNSAADTFLRWLIISSASATLIAGIVLLLQTLFSRLLTPAGRQRLWLLMILRLVLPALPASAMSLANLRVASIEPARHADAAEHVIPSTPGSQWMTTIEVKPLSHAVSRSVPIGVDDIRGPRRWSEYLPPIIVGIWAAVAWGFLLRLLWVNRVLSTRLRRATRVSDPATLQMLDECMRRAGVRRAVHIAETDAVATPAVYGILRPRILMPVGLLESLTPVQKRHVILHELSHIRHHDLLANWLLALLGIIHWFNPLLWLAFGRLKNDRELARDAWVIGRAGAGDADTYADTLFELAQRLAGTRARISTPLPGLFGRQTSLRRRLHMITRLSNSNRGSRIIGVVLLLVVGPMLLTRAKAQSKPGQVSSDTPPNPRPTKLAGQALTTKPGSDADDNAELRWTIKDLTSLAKSAIVAGRYDEALSIIDKLRSRDPGNQFVRDMRPEVLNNLSGSRRASMKADTEKLLARKIPNVNFDGLGFNNVVDYLRDVSGANIFVNWKVLERVGIDRNTPIKIRIQDATFERTLKLVLNVAGGRDVQLAYGIEDSVITISTRGDVNRNVVVRVYDIRDLVADPHFLDSKSDTPNSRKGRIDALTKKILENIDTNSWRDNGGQVGSLRLFEPSGQLIVTQTPENHRAIIAMLDSMRAPAVSQIQLVAQYLDCDSTDLEQEMKQWWAPLSLKPPTPQETASGLVLPSGVIDQRIIAFRKAMKASLLAAPSFMLLDGQEVSVQTLSKRSYISDYVPIEPRGDKQVFHALKQTVSAGVEIDATAAIENDQRSIKLTVHPKVSTLARMASAPWKNRPEGSNLMVEVPETTVTEAQIAAIVPSGQTLVITIAQPMRGHTLLILVRPTVVPYDAHEDLETQRLRHPNDAPLMPTLELDTNRKQ